MDWRPWIVPLLLVRTALLIGCGGGGSMVVSPLKVTISTDKTSYRQGEIADIRVNVENTSSEPVKFLLSGSGAPRPGSPNFSITQGNATVHTDTSRCAAEQCPDELTLTLGESHFFAFRWNQVDDRTGNPAAAGVYQVQGFVTKVDGNAQELIASDVVTIQITL